MSDVLTPVLTDNWDAERAWTLSSYEQRGGYGALKKAVPSDPPTVMVTGVPGPFTVPGATVMLDAVAEAG